MKTVNSELGLYILNLAQIILNPSNDVNVQSSMIGQAIEFLNQYRASLSFATGGVITSAFNDPGNPDKRKEHVLSEEQIKQIKDALPYKQTVRMPYTHGTPDSAQNVSLDLHNTYASLRTDVNDLAKALTITQDRLNEVDTYRCKDIKTLHNKIDELKAKTDDVNNRLSGHIAIHNSLAADVYKLRFYFENAVKHADHKIETLEAKNAANELTNISSNKSINARLLSLENATSVDDAFITNAVSRLVECEKRITKLHEDQNHIFDELNDGINNLIKNNRPRITETTPAVNVDTLSSLREGNQQRLRYFHNPNNAEWSITDWATAVGGETGELLNIIKKIKRGDFDLKNAVEYGNVVLSISREMADIIIYLDHLAMCFGIKLQDAIVEKFNYTSKEKNIPITLSAKNDERSLDELVYGHDEE